MNREEFIKIFEPVEWTEYKGDNAYQGFQIIAKYTDNIVTAAEHDEIYSEDIDKLIEKGITKEDVTKLALLNWMIQDEEYLYCFV